jgi:predicted nucleotidyltransferase
VYSLIQLKLFGSKVRGDFDRVSDIDLFIVLRQSDWQIEKAVYELCFEISLKYDVFLAPVVYSEKEVEDKLTKITSFYRNVEMEGIAI